MEHLLHRLYGVDAPGLGHDKHLHWERFTEGKQYRSLRV